MLIVNHMFFNEWSFLGEISHPSNKEKRFMNGIKGFFNGKEHPCHQHVGGFIKFSTFFLNL